MNIDLRAERLNRGLSVREAAEQMGIDKGALFRAERGTSRPHVANAFAIATFYGYQVTDVWPLPEGAEAAA